MKLMRFDHWMLMLLLYTCLLTSCTDNKKALLGHWQGHSGTGIYLEIIVDADSIYMYDTYRKDTPRYMFPKGSFAYIQNKDSFLVVHAEQTNPGVIRLVDEKNLEIGDAQNKISFTLIDRSFTTALRGLKAEESHQFRLAMIEREAKYICDKRKLSIPERQMLIDQLTKDENGFYAWLSAQR